MIPKLDPEALEEKKTATETKAPEAPPVGVLVDLACGQHKKDGYLGVDIADIPGVDLVHDLRLVPWPFEDDSVDHVHCSHFIEHLDGEEQITFMNELWRILKPGAKAFVVAPYGWSVRSFQDPTHKRPIFAECFLYYNKRQREDMGTTHGPYARIRCNFDAGINFLLDGAVAQRPTEFQVFAGRHYVNAIVDIHVDLVKQPL
jgi:SAM-dependent methyltransferase